MIKKLFGLIVVFRVVAFVTASLAASGIPDPLRIATEGLSSV